MKEMLRQIVFPFMPAEIKAESGTLLFKILNWLYPDSAEPMFVTIWPEEE